jgi:hypothetical protein
LNIKAAPVPKTILLSNGKILTNAGGLHQIETFYQRAKAFKNTQIEIGVKQMQWIDGNMSAMLGAALYRLNKENNLTFIINFKDVNERFPILFSNGLISTEAIELKVNKRTSTIPFQSFLPDDKDGFIQYVMEKLLVHDGMPDFTEVAVDKLVTDLAELCSNINLHSQTDAPFFVCGQYYPNAGRVIFTLTDLGRGFLPKISATTNGQINNAGDAILWAVEGNSSKTDAPGGIHLSKMKEFFLQHDGHMHIITGDSYYSTQHLSNPDRPRGLMKVRQEFMGSTVHLVFSKKLLTETLSG